MGLNNEKSVTWNDCMNCVEILRVELTTGLEVNYDRERGSYVLISAESDNDKNFASATHQSTSGA